MTDSPQPQDTTPAGGHRPEDHDEPNEFGFAGDATAPQPEPGATGESFGESVAVPAGDLTGAVTAAVEDATTDQDEDAAAGHTHR
jgi:hypothetical protein